MRIEVQGMDLRTQLPGRQTKQSAARSYIQKRAPVKVVHLEVLPQRSDGARNPVVVQDLEKAAPVPAEFKPLAALNFIRMSPHWQSFPQAFLTLTTFTICSY